MKDKKLLKIILVGVLVGFVFFARHRNQITELENVLIRDGDWVADEDIQKALKLADRGNSTPLKDWDEKYKQIAYWEEDQILLIAREIDFNGLSAQLKRPNTANTQSSITFYRKSSVLYTTIDLHYPISEVRQKDGEFTLVGSLRVPETEPIQQSFEISFPVRDARALIQQSALSSLIKAKLGGIAL